MIKERWEYVRDFERYKVSDLGRVMNVRTGRVMRITSASEFGHLKVSLVSDIDGERHSRSIAVLVAEAFVEPPNARCKHVVQLDGNVSNVRADNLRWFTPRYAWLYARQLKTRQPNHYYNLSVLNQTTGFKYNSIVEAGMIHGVLFADIWKSTYTGERVFPYGHTFEIIGKSKSPERIHRL